jgi:metal-responsive CopG/Arc/MetJ family transcriptional regulator
MARVNLFVPDELLKAINVAAKQAKLRRSAWLQRAAEAYIAQQEAERQVRERREQAEDVMKRIDAFATRLGTRGEGDATG